LTRVLVVNTGSSSLKLAVLDGTSVVRSVMVSDWDGIDVEPIATLLAEVGGVDAVGHRVVHGGPELQAPAVIDDAVVDRIGALVSFAPLHQPRAVAGIRAARLAAPTVPQVACFDTAYHATIPAAAATYALPAAWRRRWPLWRFGFHGLSHAYAARRAAELLRGAGGADDLRVVSCHLGAGASLCASLGGRSVDTTMGFTPLEGLVMATRSGSVDPGLVLWLTTAGGLSPAEVRDGLEHSAGLLGLAGTPDMQIIINRAGPRPGGDGQPSEAGEARQGGEAGQRSEAGQAQQTAEAGEVGDARLALDVYVHRLVREVAAMTAALGGLDVLVFTGGVGEHAPVVRSAAVAGLAFLGLTLDPDRNTAATGAPDTLVSLAGMAPAVLVIEAREDLEIARQTVATLAR
jgi:acetate kinase